MQAGLLRKRVTLQQRNTALDSFGQQLLGWVDLQILWADIEAIGGAQLARSQSIYNMTSHHIIVRWQQVFQDIKRVGSYRIVYTSAGVTRYFDIGASMNEAERNRTVILLASEGLNDGQ